MSNNQHQFFNETIVGNHAAPSKSGFLPLGTTAPGPGTAQASPRTLLGVEPGEMRGLLPDLAGIAILVAALGTYGGLW